MPGARGVHEQAARMSVATRDWSNSLRPGYRSAHPGYGCLLSPRLTAVPDARDHNIRGRRDDRVAHDITRRSEPDDDLPNIGIGCGHAKIGKFLAVRMAASHDVRRQD
jgi:hypothetical protein